MRDIIGRGWVEKIFHVVDSVGIRNRIFLSRIASIIITLTRKKS